MAQTEALEERLKTLEKELEQLKRVVTSKTPARGAAWWENMFGSFAESEGFDEAARLGKEYREALHPEGNGKSD